MFDTLTWISYWVRLKKNLQKKVGMVCHSCRAVRVREDEAYTRRMPGAGSSYKERWREWVSCTEYGKDLTRGSLDAHCKTQDGRVKRVPVQEGEG